MRVLTVDGSRASRLVVRRFMTDLGFEVAEATDGSEGLSFTQKGRKFDLLLIDWDLRGIDGPEFVRKLRLNPLYAETPVIMISAQDSRDRMMEAIEAGANEFIIKPVTKDALVTKLELLGLETECS